MLNTAKKIMDDDTIVLMDGQYSDTITRTRCRRYFDDLCKEGKIKSQWNERKWKLRDGVNPYTAYFELDHDAYRKHGYKYFKIPADEIEEALRYYAVWCMGEFVYKNITNRIRFVIQMLEMVGKEELKMDGMAKNAIKDFIHFLGLPSTACKSITDRIVFKKVNKTRNTRVLKPMANYLFIAENTQKLMRKGSLKERIAYFPVYLLSNLGMKIPLRATEWTLIPYDCLQKVDDGYILTVKRTNLKAGLREVTYDADKDYPTFSYHLPATEELQMIEWYIEVTKKHKRKYLFDFDPMVMRDAIRERFCTQSLNVAIADYVEDYLSDDKTIRWAMTACGLEKIEPFTAGDMRPIALINLYYSGASLDVCMELANHENLETTAFYISNIKELLAASAVLRIKTLFDSKKSDIDGLRKMLDKEESIMKPGCSNPKRYFDKEYIDDCPAKCLNSKSCVGCAHYTPTEEEIEEFIKEKEQELDDTIESFRAYVGNKVCSTLDRELVRLQKAHEAYEEACMMKAEREFTKWKEKEEFYGIP